MDIEARCCDVEQGLSSLPDQTIDVIVTSPPYNIGLEYNGKSDARSDYLPWLRRVFNLAYDKLKNDGHFFLQVGGIATKPSIPFDVLQQAVDAKFILQNEIVWVKSIAIDDKTHGQFKPVNSHRFLNNTHEFVFHLTKTGDIPIAKTAVGVPFVYESN